MILNFDSGEVLTLEKTGTFSNALAYSGAIVYHEKAPNGVIIDLSKTTIEDSVPLLLNHSPYSITGITDKTEIKDNKVYAAGHLAKNNKFVAEINGKTEWQLSIGVSAETKEILTPGESKIINGIEVNYPVEIWSNANIFEISATHNPVDTNTNINFFAKNEEEKMTDTTAVDLLKTQLAERDAEIVTLKAEIVEKDKTIADLTAQVTALQAAAAEIKLSHRKAEIAKLCKDKGISDKEADKFAYALNLSNDADFTAFIDSIALVKPKLPEHLQHLSIDANAGGDDKKPKINTADIYAQRAKKGDK